MPPFLCTHLRALDAIFGGASATPLLDSRKKVRDLHSKSLFLYLCRYRISVKNVGQLIELSMYFFAFLFL
jgi:hypothetical protein